ncbi:dynein light chain Tctex-type 1 [Elysia marginata]|uniref:Dynein light chain Tctex-type 1 n=1 Tax=Elysia marginata TaxID=1093978 RepID=A0AAV4IQ94_9GAST|nr:dynein light chain Tctex-type 1 [Elysia marginata]
MPLVKNTKPMAMFRAELEALADLSTSHVNCKKMKTTAFWIQHMTAFVVDEVTNIIKEAVEGAIGGNGYQHNKVNQWTSNVVEQCLNQLTKLGKPFKYIVTCVIMQKNGAGLHTASSCFWDNSTDGSCTVRWENKTMFCIVSVFGLAI